MAFVHGSTATFTLNSNDISAYVDNVSMPRALDTAEVTALGDTDKAYIGGLKGATITLSGPWDATLDGYVNTAMSTTAVTWAYSPDAGTTTYSGSCFVTAYNPSSSVSDADRWTATLQITGAVARA